MKMKKFKTAQKFCAFLLGNVDHVMDQQISVAGRIKKTLCKSEVENTIKEFLKMHNDIKHIYNVNKNEINFSVVCNGYLSDLPNSYKWSKNYVCFEVGKNNNGFYFCFCRDTYNKNAPAKYEFFSDKNYKENELLKVIFNNI